MSRMNRVLLTAGALLMLISSAAMAYEFFPNPVRVQTLSGNDGFNNNFITDSNDAYSWFGRIYRNADHVRVTWWPESTAQGLGFIKSEEGYGAYMLHLQQGYDYYDRQFDGEYNHFTLGYGYPFGSFDLGIIYNRQGISSKTEDPATRAEPSESYNTIGGGITYDMDDETVIDGTFMYMMGSIDDGDPDTDGDWESTGFGVGARAFKAMREDLTIIPVFMFNTYTDKEGVDASYYEEKGTGFGGGLGFDYTINEDNDLYLFANFQQGKTEYTYGEGDGSTTDTYTDTAMPGIGVAVEHELTDMFTMRMGASKNWMNSKSEVDDGTDVTTTEYKDYPWEFSFGMGIAMGDWVIDLALNQYWLYSAGYWFHGYDSGQTPIAQIEAKLWF